jgi:hypothetical protein
VDVFKEIRRMLHEGQEWEAREVFFERAVPWILELHTVVNTLLKSERPLPDPERLWERWKQGAAPKDGSA